MKNTRIIIGIIAMLLSFTITQTIYACTNFLITKGATTDGSCMITYSADSHTLYGELYYRPAKDYPAGTLLDVYEWDTGKFLGKIKQVPHTFSVVGNMNENQVAIGETTYGGRKELVDTTAVVDYGGLIYFALERSKSAREAIKVIAELVAEYGYCSEGESFSVSDANEVWILEMISKGPDYIALKDKNNKTAKTTDSKGAVWVAYRIPDGCISGHANHPRITTFPLEDGKKSISSKNLNKIFNPDVEVVYASDVISFAREKGYFKGKDEEFSFSDAYAPLWDETGKLVDYGAIRFCESRVWAGFRKVNSQMDKYMSYLLGKSKTRMPLWIKPDKKVTVKDIMEMMRDHFTGTFFDMTKDVGAGPFKCPYRWRPMTWNYINKQTLDTIGYIHERAISTQQTGYSFVAQSRGWLPNPIGGINWFGVDDTYSTVYVPMYCGITKVPETFKEGNGSMTEFTWNSAFWVFNWVANFAYTRYSDIIVDIKKVQTELEDGFMKAVPDIDKKAGDLYKSNKEEAINTITKFSVEQGDMTTKRWEKLGQYLFVKYMDGNVKHEKDGKFELNGTVHPLSKHPKHPAYPQEWYERIIKETGDHYKMPKE
ncbi:MAG: C69 family dipeptidase [Bacteroidia bacterium]|nr:C69 family dipeptidase [Bacteroidia bacterium]